MQVGHEQAALTANRTFKSLYVDPILSTLQKQNPQTPFVSASASKKCVNSFLFLFSLRAHPANQHTSRTAAFSTPTPDKRSTSG